jgi:hypothetical protein
MISPFSPVAGAAGARALGSAPGAALKQNQNQLKLFSSTGKSFLAN